MCLTICRKKVLLLENLKVTLSKKLMLRSQDGGGVGRGEHFLPHKFIKRAFKHRVNSTKQLLNAAEDIRHPEKQPNSSKGGRKKYKRQKKRQKREGWSSVPGRES